MAKRKRFRLRKRPVKPERKKIHHSISVYEDTTLADWIRGLPEGIDLSEVTIVKEYGYYDETWMALKWWGPEKESYYNQRVKSYERNLKSYNKWYRENEQNIKRELELREKEKLEEEERKKERHVKELARKEKRLEKELESVRKNLKTAS